MGDFFLKNCTCITTFPRRKQNKSKTNFPGPEGDLSPWIARAHACQEKPIHNDSESSLIKIAGTYR